MKRNILFSMRALVLAALVPLAGCLAEESVEEEDIDDSSEEIGATGDDAAIEVDGIVEGLADDSNAPSVSGVVLPGDMQSEPVPLPWTGSQNNDEEDDGNPFGPPPVDAASKASSTHDPY